MLVDKAGGEGIGEMVCKGHEHRDKKGRDTDAATEKHMTGKLEGTMKEAKNE